MLEDKLLIWKFKCGSSEALCRIYQKYGDFLLTLAAALLKDINAAEDIVHDVFCRFIESRDRLKLAGSLKSYLATCVLNRARDQLRARKPQPCEPDEAAAPKRDQPEFDAVFAEQTGDLNQAIAQLGHDQREVIMLHLRGDMKFREIASLQKVSINTVKSRYRYALKKLRASLSDEENKNEI